jgi:hypothetical protein
MAKKIELNKQTLRVLSAEEMEAVAGGELPQTPVGCHTTTEACIVAMPDSTITAPSTSTGELPSS